MKLANYLNPCTLVPPGQNGQEGATSPLAPNPPLERSPGPSICRKRRDGRRYPPPGDRHPVTHDWVISRFHGRSLLGTSRMLKERRFGLHAIVKQPLVLAHSFKACAFGYIPPYSCASSPTAAPLHARFLLSPGRAVGEPKFLPGCQVSLPARKGGKILLRSGLSVWPRARMMMAG